MKILKIGVSDITSNGVALMGCAANEYFNGDYTHVQVGKNKPVECQAVEGFVILDAPAVGGDYV